MNKQTEPTLKAEIVPAKAGETEETERQRKRVATQCERLRRDVDQLLSTMDDCELEVALPLIVAIVHSGTSHAFHRGVMRGREGSEGQP